MNNLQIFNNAQFGEIRTIDENGTVLFCGSDIAKALGYLPMCCRAEPMTERISTA